MMPDGKAVLGTDVGTNVMFSKVVAPPPKISRRAKTTVLRARRHRKPALPQITGRQPSSGSRCRLPRRRTLRLLLRQPRLPSLFDAEACASDGTCATAGFKSVNAGGVDCECLKVKTGKENLAATLQKRRYEWIDLILSAP
jgi:hypothetical protein